MSCEVFSQTVKTIQLNIKFKSQTNYIFENKLIVNVKIVLQLNEILNCKLRFFSSPKNKNNMRIGQKYFIKKEIL